MPVPVHPPPLLRRTTPWRRALQGCPAAASAGASPIRKVHCNSKSAANVVPSPAAAAQSGRPDDGTLQSPGADVGRVLARSAYSTTSVHMESTESSRESVCAERGAGGRNCLRWVGPYSHSIPSSGHICHRTARFRATSRRGLGSPLETGTERSLSTPPGCSRISSCATTSCTPLRTITFHAWWVAAAVLRPQQHATHIMYPAT